MNCTHDVLLSIHMRIFNLQPLEIIEATPISVVNKSPIKVVYGYVPGYKHNGCRSEKACVQIVERRKLWVRIKECMYTDKGRVKFRVLLIY